MDVIDTSKTVPRIRTQFLKDSVQLIFNMFEDRYFADGSFDDATLILDLDKALVNIWTKGVEQGAHSERSWNKLKTIPSSPKGEGEWL